jgi:zinc transport system substrate-binding protein
MRQIFPLYLGLLVISTGSLIGCRQAPTPTTQAVAKPVTVTVTLPPQAYFVQRIGGDRVQVNTLIEAGIDPHTYEPKPEQLRQMANSQLYLAIGDGMEQGWLSRFTGTNPQLQVTDTSQGIIKIPQVFAGHDHGHAHGHEQGEKSPGHENEAGLDPHIWLSPRLVKQQAQTIYQALVKQDPQHQAEYQANLQQFLGELEQLDQQIRQQLKPVKNRAFMMFHPEWGYFAKDYGLKMLAIQAEGQEPSAGQLADIINQAKQNQVKVIFTQPEFSPQTAEVIAKQLGIKVIPISALSGDWKNNLQQVTQILADNL